MLQSQRLDNKRPKEKYIFYIKNFMIKIHDVSYNV